MKSAKQMIIGSKYEPVARSIRDLFLPKHVVIGRSDDQHIRRIVSYVLSEKSNCVDVGAHRGDTLEEILRVAPEGRHIAFEPLPYLAEELESSFPSVEVHQLALGAEEAKAVFFHNVSDPGYSGLRQRRYDRPPTSVETIEVSVRRLDDVLPPELKIDLIKLDVEGGEYHVLRGAGRTIANHKPHVIMEFGSDSPAIYGVTSEMMYELVVNDYGLRMFGIDGCGPLEERDFVNLVQSCEMWNFLAHP